LRGWGHGDIAAELRLVQCSATICNGMTRNRASFLRISIFRSKFNVVLGIEAHGFCVIR
jgi:hypothetical protein